MKGLSNLNKEEQKKLNDAIQNDDIVSFRNIVGYNSMQKPEQSIMTNYYNHMRNICNGANGSNINSQQDAINMLTRSVNEIINKESDFNDKGNYESYERLNSRTDAVNILVRAAESINRENNRENEIVDNESRFNSKNDAVNLLVTAAESILGGRK